MFTRLKYAAVIFSVAVMFACTQWELSSVRRLSTDTAFFTGQLAEITRLDKELLQFRLDATKFVHNQGVSKDDVKMSFDLLWARVNTQHDKFLEPRIVTLRTYQAMLESFSEALVKIDSTVAALEPGGNDNLGTIEAALTPFTQPTRLMNEAAYTEMYERSVQTAVSQRHTMQGLDRLQWTLLLAGAAGFFILLRQLRRGEQLVGDLRARETEIRTMASTDHLTGLNNRRYFDERMQEIDDGTWSGECHLLLVDLDGFKQVNDRHGHEAGDIVLKEAAARLLRTAGNEGLLVRLGGDEFAIVIAGATDNAAAIASAAIDSLSQPILFAANSITIGASIGIATRGTGNRIAKTMMHEADMALYEAKASGRNRFCYFGGTLARELGELSHRPHNLSPAAPPSEFKAS